MRTFFGLEPDIQTKLAIDSWREKALPGLSGGVPAENFHITLAFLGETRAADIESLANITIKPFQLTLHANQVGYFSKPHIGFLAIESCPTLVDLRENLLSAIPMKLRKKDQHSFVPHITLFRNLTMPLPAPLLDPDFRFSFDQLYLFESLQKSQKTVYKPVLAYN